MRSVTRIPRTRIRSRRAPVPNLSSSIAVLLTAAALASGCSTDLQVAQTFAKAESGGAADSGSQGRPADAGQCVPAKCRGKTLACGNCLDDDQDGRVDADDPDCWGACDDDETQLSSKRACPNDACFFDPDCGGGNDADCLALTLPGCDCHGCCRVPGETFSIQLGQTTSEDGVCTSQVLMSEASCPRCEPDAACEKPCPAGVRCFGSNP